MALRPRLNPSSMASRNGSQADGARLRCSGPTTLNCTPNPVVTVLAGFESGQLSWLQLTSSSGAPAAFDPVVTALAGFGRRRPQAPGGRTPIPAALR